MSVVRSQSGLDEADGALQKSLLLGFQCFSIIKFCSQKISYWPYPFLHDGLDKVVM